MEEEKIRWVTFCRYLQKENTWKKRPANSRNDLLNNWCAIQIDKTGYWRQNKVAEQVTFTEGEKREKEGRKQSSRGVEERRQGQQKRGKNCYDSVSCPRNSELDKWTVKENPRQNRLQTEERKDGESKEDAVSIRKRTCMQLVLPSEEKSIGYYENGSRSIFAKVKIIDLDLKTIMIQWTEAYRFPRNFSGIFPFPEEGRAKVWWSTDDSRAGAKIDGLVRTVQKENNS